MSSVLENYKGWMQASNGQLNILYERYTPFTMCVCAC